MPCLLKALYNVATHWSENLRTCLHPWGKNQMKKFIPLSKLYLHEWNERMKDS